MAFILDIGGEGRNDEAWNLNPSPVKTVGRERGEPIPRRIAGRAEAIPLPDHSVAKVIMERTPLRQAALCEIARIVHQEGTIVLRHATPPNIDPHRLALAILPGRVRQRQVPIGRQLYQETCFALGSQTSPDSDDL